MSEFEDRVRDVARRLPYPPTPAPRRRWRGRKRPSGIDMRRALVMIVLVAVVVMVSPLRATVLDWLRIGAVTLMLGEAPTAIPSLPSLVALAGETTLDQARREVDFALRLPAGAGPPDHVYRQGDTVIAVWEADDRQPAFALYQIGGGEYGKLLSVAHVAEVDGQPAAWTDVPHVLHYRPAGGDDQMRQTALVEGHVLIWQAGDVTYRLESTLSLEDAVTIAESLR